MIRIGDMNDMDVSKYHLIYERRYSGGALHSERGMYIIIGMRSYYVADDFEPRFKSKVFWWLRSRMNAAHRMYELQLGGINTQTYFWKFSGRNVSIFELTEDESMSHIILETI